MHFSFRRVSSLRTHSRSRIGTGMLALSAAAAMLLGFLPAEPHAAAPPPTAEQALPVPFPLPDYRQHVRSGGPGKDGIPAIDRPQFIDATEAERFLRPKDVVFGVVRNGEIRAYPQRILVWHEIVNDRLGEERVSITYCPLTGTAMGFLRGETSFGVSGTLLNSNLVMYDRATDSRWPQILATAIEDTQAGQQLSEFQVIWTTWERWKTLHPDTQVLSTRTGRARDYNSDPYGSYNPLSGYYGGGTDTIFPVMHRDGRLPTREVVIGARGDGGAIAFRKQSLREQKLMRGEVGGVPYLAVYDPRLDTAHLFRRPRGELRYEQIEFGAEGPRWQGKPLPAEPVIGFDAFWFAWAGFYPQTALYE
jgi:hypothetical protein